MNAEELKERTKALALRIIRLCSSLKRGATAGVIGRQLLRSGTSVGAQYREAARARSAAEFISKLESVTQELDETSYWLELLEGSELVKKSLLSELHQEVEDLIRIFVTSVKTAKSNKEMRDR